MIGNNEKDSRTERILRGIIAFVVVMSFMIPLMTPKVFADTSVTISGGDQVQGGDTFTVAVTFGGGDVGRVDAQMLYDTDLLTYISGGSSSGNTGYIQLKKAGTEGSITFHIEFQAVTEGTATLDVTTNEMYDLDEMFLDTPSSSKTISISGNAEEEVLITETTSPDEPVETTELEGVDEKPDEEISEETVNLNLIFIIAAAVLVILIVIISVILARKKRNRKTSAPEGVRVGRSGRPLDDERFEDDDIEKW